MLNLTNKTMNKKNEKLIKEIHEAYNEFVEVNGKKPNVAYVEVQWYELYEGDTFNEYIAIDGVDAIHDEDILFYCNSVDELDSLTWDYSVGDFIITDIIGFGIID